MTDTASQRERILADLKRGIGITPADAWRDYGCYRLGARICELRQMGHPIVTHRIEAQGRPALYRMEGE